MAPQHDLHKVIERKLTTKRKPLRPSSVQYPARLKEGEDAQEDVTAVKSETAQHMNHSIFSMIAAARSKVDFNARFDEEEESSDNDDDLQAPAVPTYLGDHSNPPKALEQLDEQHEDPPPKGRSRRPLGQSAGRRGLRSLPKLDVRTTEEKSYMSQSMRLPSGQASNQYGGPTGVTPRDAPVMSMMLEAQAELNPSTPSLETKNAAAGDGYLPTSKDAPADLANRLMEIFGFERPEEVISGFLNPIV